MPACAKHQPREGRYFSEEFQLWYDVYPCALHGIHVDVDHDKEW
jgi:hypothetical protein